MSSDISYKGKRLWSGGALLQILTDKMYDLAIERGHQDSEPMILFILSMMQSTWYFHFDDFSAAEIRLFKDLLVEAFNQLDKANYFYLTEVDIQNRIKKGISFDEPRDDKRDMLRFIKSLEEIIAELEAQ